MVRPKINRTISSNPNIVYFKPKGQPMSELEEVTLKMDEYESIKLKDFNEFDQTKCAEKMQISQPTFNRILNQARKKISDAIINGKAIRIEKGDKK